MKIYQRGSLKGPRALTITITTNRNVLERRAVAPERSQGQEVWSLEDASDEKYCAMMTGRVFACPYCDFQILWKKRNASDLESRSDIEKIRIRMIDLIHALEATAT
jgi:DNA-directed RNA polymerase subunit RPC12/RpoP